MFWAYAQQLILYVQLKNICIVTLPTFLIPIGFELYLSVYKNEHLLSSSNALPPKTNAIEGNHRKQHQWTPSSEGCWPDALFHTSETSIQMSPQEQTNLPIFDRQNYSKSHSHHHHRVSPFLGSGGNTVDSTQFYTDTNLPSSSGACTFSVPCSTHTVDGCYIIQPDEAVTVSGDVRFKIKAKAGVLTKVCSSFFFISKCTQ